MNRSEAVTIYKEILKLSESMGSNPFNIQLSAESDLAAQGYQIRITMPNDIEIEKHITNIAKKHGLAVGKKKDEVIIYEAKKL